MSGESEYGTIPYEVDEITTFLETWLNANLPDLIADNIPAGWENAVFDTIGWTYVVSDTQLDIDITEYTRLYIAYQKQTEFAVPSACSGIFRLKFQIKAESGYTASARIYVNGVYTETGTLSTTSTTYVDKTIDLTDSVSAGDTVEIWTRSNVNGAYCKIQNYEIDGTSSYDPSTTEPTW